MAEDWKPYETDEFLRGYREAQAGAPFDQNGAFFWMRGFASFIIDRIEQVHGQPQHARVLQ